MFIRNNVKEFFLAILNWINRKLTSRSMVKSEDSRWNFVHRLIYIFNNITYALLLFKYSKKVNYFFLDQKIFNWDRVTIYSQEISIRSDHFFNKKKKVHVISEIYTSLKDIYKYNRKKKESSLINRSIWKNKITRDSVNSFY